MNNNLMSVSKVVDYIEEHLEDKLNLENLSYEVGYSKYHLHRMFTNVVGFPIHTYIQRRRLTEAARLLIFTNQVIIEIALFDGYETQRSFSVAFKKMYSYNPQVYRKKKNFHPLQLKFTVDGNKQLRGDMIMDIKIIESQEILLIGYTMSTKKGFHIIGSCMRKIEDNQNMIANRIDKDCLIALNDYSYLEYEKNQPLFNFYGAVKVSEFSTIPSKMATKKLPASKYVVFSFRGNPKDSMQPIVEYIYRKWFPQSTCQFNENNMCDFTKSFGEVDNNGHCQIEYWVPIL